MKPSDLRHEPSPEVRAMNPHIFGGAAAAPIITPKSDTTKADRRRRKRMNKTESEFAGYLQRMKDSGGIADYEFEGATLRWGTEDLLSYTPDFMIVDCALPPPGGDGKPLVRLRFIEIKGPWKTSEAVRRFKDARNYWTRFDFEMWERGKDREWRRIL